MNTTYQTAVLAKEKGFDWKVRSHYKERDIIYNGKPYNFNSKEEQKLWSTKLTSAPTQSELQKWLREKHKIHIIIEPAGKNFDLFIGYCCKTQQDVIEYEMEIINTKYEDIKMYPSYEEALEELLLEALNKIN